MLSYFKKLAAMTQLYFDRILKENIIHTRFQIPLLYPRNINAIIAEKHLCFENNIVTAYAAQH